ncbi:hypothetical protein NCCP2145_31390 [Pseudarthrobacter sp. NCCP-2145]|nr:hypothetical protein GCM10017547_42100 [Pseudarthrobacter oxydans]GKV73758.1 hypothetical protein NCCP2145_31390 [Pseudarthrobacter sp. NCCP-2145]
MLILGEGNKVIVDERRDSGRLTYKLGQRHATPAKERRIHYVLTIPNKSADTNTDAVDRRVCTQFPS